MNKIAVLVTRPDPGGQALCQSLEDAGFEALHCPTIAFAPPSDEAAMQAGLKQLGEQDWLIFVSPQAVRSAVPLIQQAWPVMPNQIQFAAIGGGTAAALKEAGFVVSALPESDWRTEGLLALPVFQQMTQQKVTIVCGDDGRADLEKGLMARGAAVMLLATYRRIPAEAEALKKCASKLKNHEIDVIICTSFDGMRYLKALMGDEIWPELKSTPLIVVGSRLEQLAGEVGFATVWSVDKVDHDAFGRLLENKKEVLCRSKKSKT